MLCSGLGIVKSSQALYYPMNFQYTDKVVATGQDGKVVSEHYLYSETLAQIQLGILLKEHQYDSCTIVLYSPQGEVVTERRPISYIRRTKV